ncbi:MAG: TRAP-type transporter small permease component [Saliniramus fredricksonii]|uniref:TRAP transporter small permease protein n=1 Tax=Saliniramus fredricksonii TaxID=1653334 RepID=A0A0P7Y452_9HYPH|nr:TRAP transporter small permease [Saliniramus fredricksonii]KPQ11320.1 MAG: TRAP-type transporter small permease component [Saliniramus fredricksonii]SCC82030.1 TRAP-type C4-dicarboxylate transport system, small permease component [Saliniramus fredricksonii]
MSDDRDIPHTPQSPDTGADHVIVSVKIEEALGAAAMALICLISIGNVLARYFTNISFAFTEEFSVVLLAFMTFVGASAAFASNEHIRITFFLQRMPRPLRWLCELVTVLVTTIMFAMIVYYGARVTYDEWFWGETSPGLGNSVWLYTIWLPILSIAIILRVLGRGYDRLIRRAGSV